jgi:hypothetical protein
VKKRRSEVVFSSVLGKNRGEMHLVDAVCQKDKANEEENDEANKFV